MQKPKLKIIMPVVAGCLLSGSVFAADDTWGTGGVISFDGAITNTICAVTGGTDFTVFMHSGLGYEIAQNTGIDSGSTEFSINVEGCDGFTPQSLAPQSLKITLSGANISSDGKYLTNTGSATGIGVALTTDGSTPVVLNEKLASGLWTTSSNGVNYNTSAVGEIKLHAHYYNYGATELLPSGSVLTNVTYMFSYD